MSFVEKDDILDVVEQLLCHSWPEEMDKISIPFPRLTYQEAIAKYGSDKPDTRFDMEVSVTKCCLGLGPQFAFQGCSKIARDCSSAAL